jgi:hypothetical protein
MKLVRIGPAGEELPAVLAVVIGQTARYLATPDDAAAVIAGYDGLGAQQQTLGTA